MGFRGSEVCAWHSSRNPRLTWVSKFLAVLELEILYFFFTADLCDPQNICKAKQRVVVYKVKGKVVPVQTLKAYGGSKA
jgi:hypothetical protein